MNTNTLETDKYDWNKWEKFRCIISSTLICIPNIQADFPMLVMKSVLKIRRLLDWGCADYFVSHLVVSKMDPMILIYVGGGCCSVGRITREE
jgi:hypothetical protein